MTMLITFLTLPTNIFLNYAFIFGKFGFPRLIGVGAGIATSLTYWIILIITITVILKVAPFTRYKILSRLPHFTGKHGRLLRLECPWDFTCAETAVFSSYPADECF